MNYSREEIVSASKCDMKANLSLVGAVKNWTRQKGMTEV